jgi:glutathione S-transferase
MTLYDAAFSLFARKVRMVVEYKELAFRSVDGLFKSNHALLKSVNGQRQTWPSPRECMPVRAQ